jgi:hypothetical protein
VQAQGTYDEEGCDLERQMTTNFVRETEKKERPVTASRELLAEFFLREHHGCSRDHHFIFHKKRNQVAAMVRFLLRMIQGCTL